MSYRSNRIALCTLAAAASLALASPAQAKFIGTSFDPPFFAGVGQFFLPDVPACLGLSTGFHTVNGGSDPCTGVLLLSASVDVSDSGGTVHLSLPPPTPSATAVTGLVIDTTKPQLVVGVNTDPIFLTAGACTGDLCGLTWLIAWDSGLPSEGGGLLNTVTLYQQFCDIDCVMVQFGSPALDVKFFPAPEPGSLALLAGALGVGWWVRRRRA